MSQLAIRNTLLSQVKITLTPLIGSNLAYENSDFNSEGLDSWCSFHFVPVTSESMGKSSASGDDERGFIQISVYIKTNALTYDNQQLTIIDGIKSDFHYGASFGDVDILEVTLNNGYTVESWFKRDLTINYSSFQSRA